MAQTEKENVQVVNLGFKEQEARKLRSLWMVHERCMIGHWEDLYGMGVAPSQRCWGVICESGVCYHDRGTSISLDLSAYSTKMDYGNNLAQSILTTIRMHISIITLPHKLG